MGTKAAFAARHLGINRLAALLVRELPMGRPHLCLAGGWSAEELRLWSGRAAAGASRSGAYLHWSEQKLQLAVSKGLLQCWQADTPGSKVLKPRCLRNTTSMPFALYVCSTWHTASLSCTQQVQYSKAILPCCTEELVAATTPTRCGPGCLVGILPVDRPGQRWLLCLYNTAAASAQQDNTEQG